MSAIYFRYQQYPTYNVMHKKHHIRSYFRNILAPTYDQVKLLLLLLFISAICNCGRQKRNAEMLKRVVGNYNKALEDLLIHGSYETRDDFTVVFQPFMQYTDVPKLVGQASQPRPHLIINTGFPRFEIPMLKIRRSHDRPIFRMGSLYW